jgi:hypothetical protein
VVLVSFCDFMGWELRWLPIIALSPPPPSIPWLMHVPSALQAFPALPCVALCAQSPGSVTSYGLLSHVSDADALGSSVPVPSTHTATAAVAPWRAESTADIQYVRTRTCAVSWDKCCACSGVPCVRSARSRGC